VYNVAIQKENPLKKNIVIILIFIVYQLCASWIDIPLYKLVEQSELIVKGEIEFIKEHQGQIPIFDFSVRDEKAKVLRSIVDTAYIKIEKIYKMNDTLRFILGDFVKIPTHSKNGIKYIKGNDTIFVSIGNEIQYSVGQRGIWLLHHYRGMFNADYPDRFQPIENEKKIIEFCNLEVNSFRLFNAISEHNSNKVLSILAENCIDPEIPQFLNAEMNPINILTYHYGANGEYKERILYALIEYGFDLNCKGVMGRTPLYNILIRKINNLDLLEFMIKNGADINIKSDSSISIRDLIDLHDRRDEILELIRKYE